jgi:hypothetical protein
MTREPLNPVPPEIEALFASEREFVPELGEIRERAMERARAVVPVNQWLEPSLRSPLRRLKFREAAAVAVTLSAACAAAFYVGYQVRNKAPAVRIEEPAVEVSGEVLLAPSLVPSVSAPATSADASLSEPLSAKSKFATQARAVTETEAYAMELRVLQPARYAVARQDYAAALSAIAEHQRRYASGKLAEEREALRVKALLGLGRTAEAQRAGVAFRARFPHSVLLGRIDELLGTPK